MRVGLEFPITCSEIVIATSELTITHAHTHIMIYQHASMCKVCGTHSLMEGEDEGVLQLDTAEVVYLNEDPLPELADLVIYTKPIRLPTQGFEVIASSQDH